MASVHTTIKKKEYMSMIFYIFITTYSENGFSVSFVHLGCLICAPPPPPQKKKKSIRMGKGGGERGNKLFATLFPSQRSTTRPQGLASDQCWQAVFILCSKQSPLSTTHSHCISRAGTSNFAHTHTHKCTHTCICTHTMYTHTHTHTNTHTHT